MMQNTLFRPSAIRENRKKFNPEGFDLTAAIEARKAAESLPPPPEDLEANAMSGLSHIAAFSDCQPTEFITPADADLVIRAAYRQVFGNAHLMANERSPEAESQLRSGDITVMEFVRQLAKSERYQTLFFDRCTNLRAIELNFKHLLGRAPDSNTELSHHIQLLADGGLEAEIDSYLDSDEYFQNFGTNIVPYYRGYDSQPTALASYTHSFQLLRGASSSDKSIHRNSAPQLQTALLTNQATQTQQLSAAPEALLAQRAPKTEPKPELPPILRGLETNNPIYKSSEFLATPLPKTSWLQEYRGREAAATFPAARQSQPVQLRGSTSGEEVDLVIRAAYKQVFGNVHLMESQRLLRAESSLKDGQLTVREFIRELAQSDTYRALFFECCTNVRAIELNFKHLLGRAPDNAQEIAEHSAILIKGGFEAEIDSYIDSAEYDQNFGYNTVPYYVSYSTQTGKTVAGYPRIFQLVKGASSSDRSIAATIASSQKAQLQTALLTKIEFSQPPVFNPDGFDFGDFLTGGLPPAEPRPPAISDPYKDALRDRPPVEFIIDSSGQNRELIIEAAYKQVFGNAHLMESERSPQIESQLRSGEITVLEFVRQLAQSDQYRARFFEPYSNIRAIELNFKHLLGRAPDGYGEISEHIQILAAGGFDAEIDSYLDSDEYFQTFGTNIVPYYRGYQTQTGTNLAGFTHAFQLLRGTSGSDKSIAQEISSDLDRRILKNGSSPISILSNVENADRFSTDTVTTPTMTTAALGAMTPTQMPYPTPQSPSTPQPPIEVYSRSTIGPYGTSDSQLEIWQTQYREQVNAVPLMLAADSSEQETEIIITAIYKQVLGNAHIMESERLNSAEAQLKSGQRSVREFVRVLAKSDLYRSRFIENSPRYRAHELNFKHLLGRNPNSYPETIEHSNILDSQGYEADIDAYIDSEEYQAAFGDDIVPYPRGYSTQPGQKLMGYTSMFEMRDSISTSDQTIMSANRARIPKQVFSNVGGRSRTSSVTDATALIRRVLNLA